MTLKAMGQWLLLATALQVFTAQAFEPADRLPVQPSKADRVFLGGDVVTVNEQQPLARALAVKNGTIVYVGTEAGAQDYIASNTDVIDLQGKALVPGFIDTHGHVSISALTQSMVDISSRRIKSLAQLLQVLRQQPVADDWLLAYGYEESFWPENRHPTRRDLDQISAERPILLVHNSMHIFVANSAALKLAGIDANTVDPTGGKFIRYPGSQEPNGVMEELAAANRVLNLAPLPSAQQLVANLNEALMEYASLGITTAQEGAATMREMQLLNTAAKAQQLPIDVTVLPYWHTVDQALTAGMGPVGTYQNRLKIAGVKIGLDGAMYAKTAYMYEAYDQPPEGKPEDYRGYLQLTEQTIFEQFDYLYRQGWQINAHVAGDAAAGLMADALQAAVDKQGERDHRSVWIHAISAQQNDMDRLATLGVVPTFYSYHVCSWGDDYVSMLGEERARDLIPTRWAVARGMRLTLHADAPISYIDPLMLMACNISRKTASGKVLGEHQRLTPYEALKAMTLNAAHQYFEEAQKGSLAVGKRADLVVLTHNPLQLPVERWSEMSVSATYKDGRQVFPLLR